MMEGCLGLLGGGGSSGASTNKSTLSKVEVVETEASSYPVEAELELGLGLSLGGGGCGGGGVGKGKANAWGECGRILTAKDFPSVVAQPHRPNNNNSMPSTCAVGAVSGTKRAADSVSHDQGGSPTAGSQVVGWPPIRAYRMNSLVNQAKAARAEEDKGNGEKDRSNENLKKKICNGNKTNATGNEKGHLGFVKVNMDGVPIGRKVDLNAHACYETLAQALEEMFLRSATTLTSIGGEKQQVSKPSKLLDGSSEFELTYEDKEGDWMLVGDVPWGMFLTSVKRLRIMRTSEANGLEEKIMPSLLADPTKATEMTITGTMNPQDDTIFLKVQISEKDGQTRNIYFPFDIMNDTAIDVAMEMVKELEITDWEPFEIADMIEEQISSLIPGWKQCSSSQIHHPQHCFSYEDDDDDQHDGPRHPFYANSSHSSSHASLLAFNSSFQTKPCQGRNMTPAHDWFEGKLFIDDDESSQSSLNSFKDSNLNYSSGYEDNYDASLREEPLGFGKTHQSTRFFPADSLSEKQNKQRNARLDSWGCSSSNPQRKLSRIRSQVDVRSQLLHRSLLEEINKRRLFKTVGAAENIGYHEPGLQDDDEKKRFKW